MKKLLITTLAAVSVGLCAKAADDGLISGTSFEGLTEGDVFTPTDTYWTIPTDTDDVFKITNVTYSADATKQHWDWTEDGEKALAIDTANPILRNVNALNTDVNPPVHPAQDVSETPVFFDSVVQFTATDVAPSMENNTTDKLAVWLYQSPEDVSDTNPGLFKETTAKKTLVITAGVLETNDGVQSIVKKDYDTGIEIEPESWHRLTIKSFLNEGKDKLMFNVWIDGAKDPITAEGVTDFLSLVTPNEDSDNYLQGVAFDGKGAVDDIVFTTTAPEFANEPEAETYAIVATGDNAQITFASDEYGDVPLDDVSALDVTTTTVYGYVIPHEGYEVTSAKFNGSDLVVPEFDGVGYNFLLPIGTPKNGDEYAFVVTVTEKAGGGDEPGTDDPEDPAKPTIGGNAVDTAEAFIAAANSGVTIKVPTDWTLDGNTLKDADGNVYATFADYYTVTLETDGTVTLKLNDNAKPTIGETATDADDAIVLTDTTVSLGVTNAKDGLWYGVQEYSDAACTTKVGDVTGWAQATGETVTVTATKPEGDKAFFKVVVDDQDHSSEEQN